MLRYLSLDIICSSKLTVFHELRSRKTVRFSEQKMSADKYLSIFSRQMEVIVYISNKREWNNIVNCEDINENSICPPPPPTRFSVNLVMKAKLSVKFLLRKLVFTRMQTKLVFMKIMRFTATWKWLIKSNSPGK